MALHHSAPSVVYRISNLVPFAELLHGITTRNGGVSGGPFKSFNLSFDVGDRYDSVRRNYRRLSRLLSFDLTSLVACQQVHHNAITLIDASYRRRSCYLPDRTVPATDGLATNVPGITLLTRHADCVPLLFFSPAAQAVAIAHAGWKGTLARIGPAMMEALTVAFHCRPEQTLVAIGPSIGPCCYHISAGMADLAERQLPPKEHCVIDAPKGRFAFDLWRANKMQMMEAGLQEHNIFCAGICTACNTDLFFSYRKEARLTGRFGAVIGLKWPDAG